MIRRVAQFLGFFLAVASVNSWSVTVSVEAMIGDVVITVVEEECPPESQVVRAGQSAQTNPETCKTVVVESSYSDDVNRVVQLIASQGEADEQLAELSTEDQVLVVAVLVNNADQLDIDASVVADTVGAISEVNPEGAAAVVFISSVLDQENAESYVDSAKQAAPEQEDNIDDATEEAEGFNDDSGQPPPPPTGSEGEQGEGGEGENGDNQGTDGGDPEVPPGGSLPEDEEGNLPIPSPE